MFRCRRMVGATALLALAACGPTQTLPPAAAVAPTIAPTQPAVSSATPTPETTPTPVSLPTPTPAPASLPIPTSTTVVVPSMSPTTVPTATSTPAPPALPPVSGDRSMVIVRVKTDKPYVTITVDDFFSASNYQEREGIRLLQAAKDLQVALTLCPTGYAMEAYNIMAPDQLAEIKQLVAAGHYDICDHTLSHPRMSELDGAQQQHEISASRQLVEQYLEHPIAPFFRPPFGVWNEDTRRVAMAAGYPYIVDWSVDSGDWEGKEPPSLPTIMANLSCVQAGDIILMHANRTRSAEMLPVLVAQLRAKGLEPVTLSTLLTAGEPVLMHDPHDKSNVKFCPSAHD